MRYRPIEPQEYKQPTDRPVIADELLIHARVLGQCIHRDHRVEFEREGYGEACVGVCTKCGASKLIDFKPRGSKYFHRSWPPPEQPADFIKHIVPQYTTDVVLARSIARDRLRWQDLQPCIRRTERCRPCDSVQIRCSDLRLAAHC